ncbi:flagellin [Clostridium sp.]|uniref:flagellin N-terminal helical domain-containing protein n=1 Tax=Clostridium sp. TaxID=1506 RepID=UPI003D6D91A9
MIINHNLGAMNANRNMGINASNANKSMEKLSSGLRINKAGDDAAGLAISEKMRGQIRGLDQAGANAQDSISLLQTGEGALNETTSILQRMRELAVQGSNDTLNSNDRGQIQKEMDQLVAETDRIGNNTEFNTKKLLNGGANVSGTVTGADAASIAIVGGTGDTTKGAVVTMTAATVATAATDKATTAQSTTALAAASTITVNGTSFSFELGTTNQNVLDTINNAGVGVKATLDASSTFNITANSVGSASKMDISGVTGDFAGIATDTGTDAVVTIAGGAQYSAVGNNVTIQDGTGKGLELNVLSTFTGGTATSTVDNNGTLSFQIGANEGQMLNVGIADMRSAALGTAGVKVTDSATATAAITTIQTAIDTVSSERSKLGAFSNRLEHTIANLGTASENMTSAESRIRDVDMAKEMSTFSKNNILNQAAQAMLAQANQQPQQVLQLLR